MKKIKKGTKLDFDDVLIEPTWTELGSRSEVNLTVEYNFPHSGGKFTGIPIIATNMDTVATVRAALEMERHECFTWLHKFLGVEEEYGCPDNNSSIVHLLNKDHYAPTIGLDFDYEKDAAILETHKYVNVDVANGYMEKYLEHIEALRIKFPKLTIFAGTICTPLGTKALFEAGADVVRVGIGTGGQCITRTKAGVGYPQVSALIECSAVADEFGGFIVSDGGCRTPGDVAKAFVAGADFVSLGSILAAHEENTDEIVDQWGTNWTQSLEAGTVGAIKHAKVYGMSSTAAMDKHYGKVDSHRTSEGKIHLMPFKGPLKNTLQDILGGVRSACTYTNSHNLQLLQNASFIKVNRVRNTHFDQHKIGE